MNIEMRQMSRYENSPLSQRSGISHSLPENVRKMYGLARLVHSYNHVYAAIAVFIADEESVP
jgi:hypothetical protein